MFKKAQDTALRQQGELPNLRRRQFQINIPPDVILLIDLALTNYKDYQTYLKTGFDPGINKHKGLANVLKYLYDNPKYRSVEGATIRHFLESKTNVKIPNSLSNHDLGRLFDFGGGNTNTLTIQFSDYAKKYITNFHHYDGKYGTSLFTDPFKLQALEEILKGNTVDFQNEIIKDPSFTGTKADCILKLLLRQNGYFKDVMNSFTNNNSVYKIKYEVKPLTKQNSAGDGETPPPDRNGIITIRISPSALSNNSLDLASTILHESVHAMLHRILATNNRSEYNLSTADYNWLLKLNAFWSDNSAFPEITTQHDFMTVRYVIPIAKAVRSLDKNRYPLKNYMFFGWSGLYDEGKNRGLINRSAFTEFSKLADVPLNDNHKTPCD